MAMPSVMANEPGNSSESIPEVPADDYLPTMPGGRLPSPSLGSPSEGYGGASLDAVG